MIDPGSYVPVYRQIADDLRGRIRSGELPPGRRLPAEDRLADSYGVGKDAVRGALKELRAEGLIRTVHRVGSYVREPQASEVVTVDGPARVRARMPTPEERRQWQLEEGVPVLVVETGGQTRVFPGDRTELDVPEA